MEFNFNQGRKDISNRLRNLIIIPEKIREFRQELNQKFAAGEISKAEFDEASIYLDRKENEHYAKTPGLREALTEIYSQLEEELCPAGKRYIAKRKAAGEKSSAYLSGRAVKVCKGQMKG